MKNGSSSALKRTLLEKVGNVVSSQTTAAADDSMQNIDPQECSSTVHPSKMNKALVTVHTYCWFIHCFTTALMSTKTFNVVHI